MRRILSLALAVTALSLGLSSCASYQPFPPAGANLEEGTTLLIMAKEGPSFVNDLGAINRFLWEAYSLKTLQLYFDMATHPEMVSLIRSVVEPALFPVGTSLGLQSTLVEELPAEIPTNDEIRKNPKIPSAKLETLGLVTPYALLVFVDKWEFHAGPRASDYADEVEKRKKYDGFVNVRVRFEMVDTRINEIIWEAKNTGQADVPLLVDLPDDGLMTPFKEALERASKPVFRHFSMSFPSD